MDNSISLKNDPKKLNTVFGLFYNLENATIPNTIKHKNTVIKYTKLPNFNSTVSWSHHNYSLHPRLRRIIPLEDQPVKTTRSLKQNLVTPVNMSNCCPKRKIKIITIADDEEVNHCSNFSKHKKKPSSTTRTSNKNVRLHYINGKSQHIETLNSKDNHPTNYPEESTHHYGKPKDLNYVNELNKQNKKQLLNKHVKRMEYDKTRTYKDKGKDPEKSTKNNLSKNIIVSVENEKEAVTTKQTLCHDSKKGNKPINRNHSKKVEQSFQLASDVTSKKKPTTIIYIPQEEKLQKQKEKEDKVKIECAFDLNDTVATRTVGVGTNPLVNHTSEQMTQVDTNFDTLSISTAETNEHKDKFDNLHVPDVELKKERKDLSNEIVNFYNTSLPNLEIPRVDIFSLKSDKNTSDSCLHKSSSYIIGQATVTYTRQQKIDIHVLNNDEIQDHLPVSLVYPLNVVSIFKKESKNRQSNDLLANCKKKHKKYMDTQYKNNLNFVNCSHVSDSYKLMKPSDIINTIRVNNSLLQSDYISEQFQKELNFIDSFFESLQYLEKLSDKYFTDVNLDNWTHNKQFEGNDSDYASNFTKIENGFTVDDSETMASKSLCQLNLLIQNEQRRARDFLFVLKMQEDVLKDYIKSQMLWLEKKKKQDNTDISALKKKQRGALLKLQHECGEMQRMRKALLTLSEKRKTALMKTKKNIEMKLSNNVDVERILLGKKKLKRNTGTDRCFAPLKCFDLSSSGCEDTTTSREKSESTRCSPLRDTPYISSAKRVTSAEKSIQTGDSILAVDLLDQSTQITAAENCVGVDGGYLNILFHNLSLPQIFSNGKQYEVNEEALKNIVHSSNSHNNMTKDADAFEKLVDQIKNHDMDESSSVSTAYSLVEEFEQYYKCLGDEEKSLTNSPECDNHECVLNDCGVQSSSGSNSDICDHNSVTMITMDSDENLLKRLSDVYGIDSSFPLADCEPSMLSVEIQASRKEPEGVCVAGPLPVPAGAADPVDEPPSDVSVWMSTNLANTTDNAASDEVFSSDNAPISQYASPALYEAEELRRQQLAIEREIKALEQQQCQLLVVREIPDKPPPPYTPPSEGRMAKSSPRKFLPDGITEEKIQRHCVDTENDLLDMDDPFDAFFKDFCEESIERQRSEKSDQPWDACNLLPQRPQPDTKKTVEKTCTDLKEVLSGATPSFVSGVSSRRTDHIDDILFAEWRRCEPEWTSLHTDEASVKNQLFDSIFKKIFAETVDEYKSIVCSNKDENE